MEKICMSQKRIDEIRAICKEHGNDPGELINILHTVQGKLGYLPKEVQELIAMELGIPAAKVYGVVTFYSFFTMKPKGKYPISVCMGTACYVRGAEKVLDEFKRQLGIEVGETTADGLFSLDSLRGCLRSRSGRDGGPEGIRPPHAVERQGHHRRIRKPGTGGLTAFLPTCPKGRCDMRTALFTYTLSGSGDRSNRDTPTATRSPPYDRDRNRSGLRFLRSFPQENNPNILIFCLLTYRFVTIV